MKLSTPQIASLIGHRQHSMTILRRFDYITLCPSRRPAIKRELISIQERLAASLEPRKARMA